MIVKLPSDSPFLKQIIQQTGTLLISTYFGTDILLGIFPSAYVISRKIQRDICRLDFRCGYHFYKRKSPPFVTVGLELQSWNRTKFHHSSRYNSLKENNRCFRLCHKSPISWMGGWVGGWGYVWRWGRGRTQPVETIANFH